MCKHNWQLILPLAQEVPEEKRVHYLTDVMLSRLGDICYCDLCKRTAHKIKSHRGGMRLHHSNYFIERSNKIRKEYGLPMLGINEKFITTIND